MANEVFANTREISCKKADGKGICAFPDVCMTPPTTPATPAGVPIPYPNTAFSKDTANGSRTVKISDKEIMLKNKSYFKTSTGDEAGCATPAKKGIVTGKIKGKLYFTAWSMDVKAEGKNVVRHLDIATHNHASFPGNTPTWPYVDTINIQNPKHDCVKDQVREMFACSGHEDDPCSNDDCKHARKCSLAPFKAPKKTLSDVQKCCPGETGHHVIPVQEFSKSGKPRGRPLNDDVSKYNQNLAPCICVEGGDHKEYNNTTPFQLKEHGLIGSAYIDARLEKGIKNNQQNVKYNDLKECGAKSVCSVHKHCNQKCIEKQLDNYHNQTAKIPKNKPVCRASQQSKYDEFDSSQVRST